MEPWSFDVQGHFVEHTLTSEAPRGNPLGDPYERPLWVYVSPGYGDDPESRFPAVYAIEGLTGQFDMWRKRAPFRRNFPELVDDLFAAGRHHPWWSCGWTAGRRSGEASSWTRPGTGNYLTTCATRSSLSLTSATGRSLTGASRHPREIERRLWGDGRADASAQHVGRAGDPRR